MTDSLSYMKSQQTDNNNIKATDRNLEYDSSKVESHDIFIKHKDLINKIGITTFIRDAGIFIQIIPTYKPPNENNELILIAYSLEIEYRLNIMKDANHYEMEIIHEHNKYPTKYDALTSSILMSLDLINENKYMVDRIINIQST